MKKEQVYSADDVIRMMREAHSLGMTTVEVAGFKGAFSMRAPQVNQNAPATESGNPELETLGNLVTPFGNKYRGWPLSKIPRKDLRDYVDWHRGEGENYWSPAVQEWLGKAERYLELLGQERRSSRN